MNKHGLKIPEATTAAFAAATAFPATKEGGKKSLPLLALDLSPGASYVEDKVRLRGK